MRYMILFLTLYGCASIDYGDTRGMKVVKFERFGKIRYDYVREVGVIGDRAYYVKEDVVPVTNYVKGDIEVIPYWQYLAERKRGQ